MYSGERIYENDDDVFENIEFGDDDYLTHIETDEVMMFRRFKSGRFEIREKLRIIEGKEYMERSIIEFVEL